MPMQTMKHRRTGDVRRVDTTLVKRLELDGYEVVKDAPKAKADEGKA